MFDQFCQWLVLTFFHVFWIGIALWVLSAVVERIFCQSAVWKYNTNLSAYLAIVISIPILSFYLYIEPNLETHRLSALSEETVSIPNSTKLMVAAKSKELNSSSIEDVDSNLSAVSADVVGKEGVEEAGWQSDFPVFDTSHTYIANENAKIIQKKWNRERFSYWDFYKSIKHLLSSSIFSLFGFKIISALYGLGLMVMVFRLGKMIFGLSRLEKVTEEIPDRLLSRIQVLAKKHSIKWIPIVQVARQIAVPAVYGIFKPVLLLPPSISSGLTVRELDSILLHELAHLRRWDPAVVWIQRIAETILFFHPAVWFIGRRLDTLREQCCDDFVLKSGVEAMDYASGLFKVANSAAGKDYLGLINNAQGSSSKELLIRIRRILNEQPQLRFRFSFPLLVFTAVALVFFGFLFQNLYAQASIDTNTTEEKQRLVANNNKDTNTKRFDIFVVDENSQPVSEALVRIRSGDGRVITRIADRSGRLDCDLSKWNFSSGRLRISSISPSRNKIGRTEVGYSSTFKSIVGAKARFNTTIENVTILLEPAIEREVTVTAEGRPVRNAEVALSNDNPAWASGRTDAQGAMKLVVPISEKEIPVVALHPEKGMGFSKRKGSEISLLKPAPIKVDVKNSENEPVAAVDLEFRIYAGSEVTIHSARFSSLNQMKTNQNGQMVITCIPEEYQNIVSFVPKVDSRYDLDPPSYSPESIKEKLGLVKTIRVKKKETAEISGQLFYQGEKVRERVQVRIFENEGTFPLVVRSDRSGRFNAIVRPGARYNVSVFGENWEGGFSKLEVPKIPSNKSIPVLLEKTHPFEIHIKSVSGNKPIPNAYAFLQMFEVGKSESGGILASVIGRPAGRRFGDISLVSDNRGRIKGRLPEGQGKLLLGIFDLSKGKEIVINGDSKNIHHVEMKSPLGRLFKGRMIVPDGVDPKNMTIKVSNRWMMPTSRGIKVDSKGKWSSSGYGWHEVKVECYSEGRRYGGVSHFTIRDGKVPPMKLKETAILKGRLVDRGGQPLAFFRVRQMIGGKSLLGRELWNHSYCEAMTDKDGRFVMTGLVPGFQHKLVSDFPANPFRLHFLNFNHRFKSGETINAGDVIVDFDKK